MGFFEKYKKKIQKKTLASFKKESAKERTTKIKKFLDDDKVARKEIEQIKKIEVKKKKKRKSSNKNNFVKSLIKKEEEIKSKTPAGFKDETIRQSQTKALKYNIPIKRVSNLQMKLNSEGARINKNIKKLVKTKQFKEGAKLTLEGRDKVVNVLNKYQNYLRTSDLNNMTKSQINSTRRNFLNKLENEQNAKLDKGIKEGFLIGSAQILKDPLKYKADEDVQDVVDMLTKPKETVKGTVEFIKENPTQYIGEVGAEYAIFGTVEAGIEKFSKKGKKFLAGAGKELSKKFGGKKLLKKVGSKFIPYVGQVSTVKDIYDVLKAGYKATIPIKAGETKTEYNNRLDKKVENDLKVEVKELKKDIKGDKKFIKKLQKDFKLKQKKEKETKKKVLESEKELKQKKKIEDKKIKKSKQDINKKKSEIKKLDEKIKNTKNSKTKNKYKKLKKLKTAQIKSIKSKIEVKKKEKKKQKVEKKQKGKQKINKAKQKLKEKQKKKKKIKESLKAKKKLKEKEKQKKKEKKKLKTKEKEKFKPKIKLKKKRIPIKKKKLKISLTLDKRKPKKSVSVFKAKVKAEKHLIRTAGRQTAKIISNKKIKKVTKKRPSIKYKLSKSGKTLKLSEKLKKASSKKVSKVSKFKKIKKSSKIASKKKLTKKPIKKTKKTKKRIKKKSKSIKRLKKKK